MGEMRNKYYTVLVGTLKKKPLLSPKNTWEDNIKMSLKRNGV
jgi:hypothetical protein